MRNIKLVIEYDGTSYSGWQKQKNAITIQQKIEEAIKKITGEIVEVIGCSRTDAGVHARAYVANFNTETNIPAYNFKNALNSKLPEDIVILNSEEVELDFHARYNSKGKMYSYSILNRDQRPAIGRNYMYHHRGTLNIEHMREAAEYLIGTHDYSAFKNTGSSAKTSTRTIYRIDIQMEKDMIKIYIAADGFLYNMARIICGTLLKVGSGKFSPDYIKVILASKDRKKAGKALPACGLCLEEVYYI